MKKNLLLLLTLFVLSTSGQVAYYDAIELRKLIDPKTNKLKADTASIKAFAGIIAVEPYFDEKALSKKQKANSILQKVKLNLLGNHYYNPFLAKYIDLGTAQSSVKGQPTDKGNLGFLATGSSNLDATKFANALAVFMIKRAKAELTVAFFDRFKKFLDKNPEVELLYPKTSDQLTKLLSVEYRQMIKVLREAFLEDLQNMPDNAINVLEYIGDKESFTELILVTRVIRQAEKLEYLSVPDFIEQLPTITDDDKIRDINWVKNLNASLELTVIFSNSVRSTNNENWIPSKDLFKNILSDPIAFDLYLGLIYQQINLKKIKIGTKIISQEIRSEMGNLNWYKGELEKLIKIISAIDENIKASDAAEGNKNEYLYNYIESGISLSYFGLDFIEHHSTSSYNELKSYIGYIESANDIFKYTYEKKYASAVTEFSSLYELLRRKAAEKSKPHYQSLINRLDAGTAMVLFQDKYKGKINPVYGGDESVSNYEKSILEIELKKLNKKTKKNISETKYKKKLKKALDNKKKNMDSASTTHDKIIRQVTKYGVFMANIVEAENEEETIKAIESVALPVGSSSLKKRSEVCINLSSYLGFRRTEFNDSWLTQVTAPIGVEFGFGIGRNGRAGAIGLNLVVLDIGAIVEYNLSDTNQTGMQKVETSINWGNIFSPGVQLSYGLPWNIPISIGVTGQYGPGLVNYSSTEVTIENDPQWQMGFFIAVDIPLINFYNSPKK